MDNKNCRVPFGYIEIAPSGDVYTCCRGYINNGCIGNIFQKPFQEILNSDKAREIRESVLNNDYSMCNKFCEPGGHLFAYELNSHHVKNICYNSIIPNPNIVKLSYDFDCNVKCITCRDSIIRNSKETVKELNDKFEKYFLPIFKDVDIVCLSGVGDPLASQHAKHSIKLIIEEYPNIKFDLHTNGLLLTKENLKQLGLLDKLSTIQISIHAAKKETYEKIVIGASWDKLMQNLKFISQLKQENKLFAIHLNFVVHSMNYKEMKDFVTLSSNLGADVFFWNYRSWGTEFKDKSTNINYKYEVHEILKDSYFKRDSVHIYPYLNNIEYFMEDFIGAKLEDTNNRLEDTNNRLEDTNNRLEDTNNRLEDTNNKINNIKYNENWIKFFGIFNNKEYLKIVIFGINIVFKIGPDSINKIAWWIPIKKWRDNFRKKFE